MNEKWFLVIYFHFVRLPLRHFFEAELRFVRIERIDGDVQNVVVRRNPISKYFLNPRTYQK